MRHWNSAPGPLFLASCVLPGFPNGTPDCPHAQSGREQGDLLFDEGNEQGGDDKLDPATRVHSPKGPQDQRNSQRRGVEFGEDGRLQLRRQQVGNGQAQRQRPCQLLERLALPDPSPFTRGEEFLKLAVGQRIKRPCPERDAHHLQKQNGTYIVP